ncbi:MAG: recombinase family protein [Clostridiales bacterium]|nr:recombinase family protein [Clostridiales bacterium]
MARKSRQARQQNLLAPTEFTHKEPENRYQTALYGRLSLQNLGIGRKETMEYQIEILREYVAKHPDLEVVDIYTDNGCSGSNFNRPEFNRMMEDVKKGRINCIVIRDFSRFGRNYLETGYYLQQVFPAYQVRFISIFDEFDSAVSDLDAMVFSMKHIVNDFYSKDISRKISSAYDALIRNGHVWGKPAFGYRRRQDSTGRLLMDEKTAPTLYLIFQWARQGVNPRQIACNLNILGIPSNRLIDAAQNGNTFLQPSDLPWQDPMIRAILRNPMYTGDTVFNRYRNRKYDSSCLGDLPKEEWDSVPHTHPAYITHEEYVHQIEVWEQSQRHWNEKTTQSRASVDNPGNPFRAILFCGECQHTMMPVKSPESSKTIAYSCKGHFKVQIAGHLAFSIPREELMNKVSVQLQEQRVTAKEIRSILFSYPLEQIQTQLIAPRKTMLVKHQARIQEIELLCTRAEQDRRRGILEKEIYQIQSEKLLFEKNALTEEINLLSQQIAEVPSCLSIENPWLQDFTGQDFSGEIASSTLHQLISRIDVMTDKSVHILLKNAYWMQRLISYIEEWKQNKEKGDKENGQ